MNVHLILQTEKYIIPIYFKVLRKWVHSTSKVSAFTWCQRQQLPLFFALKKCPARNLRFVHTERKEKLPKETSKKHGWFSSICRCVEDKSNCLVSLVSKYFGFPNYATTEIGIDSSRMWKFSKAIDWNKNNSLQSKIHLKSLN